MDIPQGQNGSNSVNWAIRAMQIQAAARPPLKATFVLLASFMVSFMSEVSYGMVDNQKCQNILSQLPPGIQPIQTQVPENWKNPEEGPDLTLAFYLKLTETPYKSPTIVFFNGGPGYSALSSMQIFSVNQNAKRYNWVFIDQRGTGCSSAFPRLTAPRDALDRLPHYGSRAIVHDAEHVRRLLAGHLDIAHESFTWSIFGQSFGGTIALRYLSIFPRHLNSVFVHGSSVSDAPKEWIKHRVLGQDRVLKLYFQQYPEDRKKIKSIQSRIKSHQCFHASDIEICGPHVLDALLARLGFKNQWPAFHEAIKSLYLVPGFLLPVAINTQIMPEIAKEVTPEKYVIGRALAGGDLKKICNEILDENLDINNNVIMSDCHIIAATSASWYQQVLEKPFYDPLSTSDLKFALETESGPTLKIFSSLYDGFSPIETYDEMLQKLRGHLEYFPLNNSGHEGFYSEQKVWSEMAKIVP